MSDPLLTDIAEGIIKIELPPPEGGEAGFFESTNVYFIDGPAPALINAGHPVQGPALAEALREIGPGPAGVERIIATSWRVDILGGATHFPRADLFLLSPDMRDPRHYDGHLTRRRSAVEALSEEIAAVVDTFDEAVISEAAQAFWPSITTDLRFIPLRHGHQIRAGHLLLEVLSTAGPSPGHMALFEADQRRLFCGDFAMGGFPGRLENPRNYLVGLQRLAELKAQRILPNRGRIFEQGRWTVNRATTFFTNCLSNAPLALVQAPTVLEFVERDRGLDADQPLALLKAYEFFQAIFEELVRSRSIAAEGQGASRRYGVELDDPRKELRR